MLITYESTHKQINHQQLTAGNQGMVGLRHAA